MEEYDGVSAELAWSRSLGTARKVFGVDPDLELVLEGNLQSMFNIPSQMRIMQERVLTIMSRQILHSQC
jgi:hypothetical protein